MRMPIVALLCGSLAVAVAGAPGPTGAPAYSLSVVEPLYRAGEIVVATSAPPQFDLMLERDMPTTGWALTVDAVEVDDESRRIVARISEIAPAGAAAQVITATPCRLPLGKLTRGLYVVEIWQRRGATDPYGLVQTMTLRAR
jgi:hypothetical protein